MKIKINRKDKERILLTELLPYEVPIIFSNKGLYRAIKNGKYNLLFSRVIELKKSYTKDFTIPFDYSISKDKGGERKLSIIHPVSQFEFISFYYKYDQLILSLCSRSEFSLRFPANIAKFYYTPDLVIEEEEEEHNEEVEVEPEILDQESRLLKSYFNYRKYDLIYKFFDSYEFFKLEQRFQFVLSLDISKCFYNIYTHSICWAVKDKHSAKENSKKISFENTFDTLMQKANYNETNGILVGPEISRIFAEIILQKIDVDVQVALEELGVRIGSEYEIKRYVDDYYVFANQQSLLERILKILEQKLEFYKLYFNTDKTLLKASPFVHEIAVCRFDIKTILNEFENIVLKSYNDENQERHFVLEEINRPQAVSRELIKKMQYATKRNNLTYDIIGKEVLGHCKKTLTKALKRKLHLENEKTFVNLCLVILDIAFFAYSMDTRVNTTFKISQLLVLVCKAVKEYSPELKHTLFSKIVQEADHVMSNFRQRIGDEKSGIEILNLLIALKEIRSQQFLYSEARVKRLIGIKEEEDIFNLNYFELLGLLYYIEDEDLYAGLKSMLEKAIMAKFVPGPKIFSSSELTMLFFDSITCPYIKLEVKRKIIRLGKYADGSNEIIDARINDICSNISWFIDWDTEIDLERVLKEKEWRSSY